ncbi:MAG TPA: hypothetical protein VHA53_03640, partial [Nitrolancea sp.]|nr:hypothetical protein [Nitrolancea sp.]
VQQGGVSPVPGLYFIGRSWQSSRGSALLTGVGSDAADVTRHLVQQLTRQGATAPAEKPTKVAVAAS